MTAAVEMLEEDARRDFKHLRGTLGQLLEMMMLYDNVTARELIANIRERCTTDDELNEDLYVKTISTIGHMDNYADRLFMGLALMMALGTRDRSAEDV